MLHTHRPVPSGAVLASGLFTVAATIAVFRSFEGISPTTVGVTLLLVVLATATFGRLWIAITVAIVIVVSWGFTPRLVGNTELSAM